MYNSYFSFKKSLVRVILILVFITSLWSCDVGSKNLKSLDINVQLQILIGLKISLDSNNFHYALLDLLTAKKMGFVDYKPYWFDCLDLVDRDISNNISE